MQTKKRSSLRNTNQASGNAFGSNSISHPQGNDFSQCKQVSRLGIILLARLPAQWQWLHYAFVRFTVTGIARKFHPIPMTARGGTQPRVAAQIHRLFICPFHYISDLHIRQPCGNQKDDSQSINI